MQWKRIVCQVFFKLRQELLERLGLQSQASMSQIYKSISTRGQNETGIAKTYPIFILYWSHQLFPCTYFTLVTAERYDQVKFLYR